MVVRLVLGGPREPSVHACQAPCEMTTFQIRFIAERHIALMRTTCILVRSLPLALAWLPLLLLPCPARPILAPPSPHSRPTLAPPSPHPRPTLRGEGLLCLVRV